MFASKDVFLTPPSAGGYSIARSVRLRSSATAYFNRTAGSAATDGTKWTISCWVKRGILDSGASLLYTLMSAEPAATTYLSFYQDTIYFQINDGGAGRVLQTTQVFRDPSAWYHCVFVWDRGAATASQKMRLYINGAEVTSFSTDNRSSISGSASPGILTQSVLNTIGRRAGASADYYDGYITEFNAIDGQALTPSSFGETDSITGVWKPKAYSGTYGTNGFELNFSDNSNNTATTIGKDYSGNGNNWTPNNISVTAGATYDSMTDVPTLTSATAANYCTFNPLYIVQGNSNANSTWSDGNLKFTNGSTANVTSMPTMALPTSGKWYWEITVPTFGSGSNPIVGICDYTGLASGLGGWWYRSDGNKYDQSATAFSYGASWTAGTVISVAVDMDAATLTFYKNGVSQGVAWTSITTGVSGTLLYPFVRVNATGDVYTANFGQQGFSYTPPTGFVALNTYNLPASTITNGAAYMAATTYTGAGGTQSVTNTVNGVSFQPDFVWGKARSVTYSNALFDSVRGFGSAKGLLSNATQAEGTTSAQYGYVSTNTSTGFTATGGTDGSNPNASLNESGVTYVAWQWKAGGTAVSNTAGSITSTVSVGATQGFSVVTYTGTGANATVGHGLGVAPNMVIVKCRSNASTNWTVYHTSLGNTGYIYLNLTNAAGTGYSGFWNSTSPTSSVFSLGSDVDGYVNGSGRTNVAYCFASVAGFSSVGSYTGNGSTDGPMIYLGFKPRWFMSKRSDTAGNDWVIMDTSRDTYNVAQKQLYADLSNAEEVNSVYDTDFLSNGLKIRTSTASRNASGGTYIYMAFAEVGFKSALAR